MLNLATKKIIYVKPPLREAQKKSKTKQVGILATKSAINNKDLDLYIKQNNFPKKINVFKINGSDLVELVESGKFHSNKKYSRKTIKRILDQELFENNIDTILLSSTHLPFLRSLLEKEYPKVRFIDPADKIAKKVLLKVNDDQKKRNSLKIFASGNIMTFQRKLEHVGIKNKVNSLSI